jgi:hypothetical protein
VNPVRPLKNRSTRTLEFSNEEKAFDDDDDDDTKCKE